MTALILNDLTDLLTAAGEAASTLAVKARMAVADRHLQPQPQPHPQQQPHPQGQGQERQ